MPTIMPANCPKPVAINIPLSPYPKIVSKRYIRGILAKTTLVNAVRRAKIEFPDPVARLFIINVMELAI